MELKYTIPLDPRTKKNHQMIAGAGARCPRCGKFQKQFIRQGSAHGEYQKAARWYVRPKPVAPIEEPVNVQCIFYMQTRRKVDTLNLLATVDDLLVEEGILKDDCAAIVVSHDGSRVRYDKENPRTEITITGAAG